MTRLTWSDPTDRTFETGLDRGVLYPKDGPAVPWNGLTSVDENSGSESVSYYIDGRAYLHFPKPKEFSASLKAYTYPPEFAKIMGEVEAAAGMYLDSQVGEAFDLSYRTLIGNAIRGVEAGYKIHLIYNATVVPPSKSYQSLSNSVNPTDFTWEIKAVPVSVIGYHPTAHVTIDTRRMDPDRLAEIEALIYGDGSGDASMPELQAIFDVLSYGDAIVITDNGDGTWTAEGSSANIFMIGDGVFQINNVNATDNGDGTYEISTTP